MTDQPGRSPSPGSPAGVLTGWLDEHLTWDAFQKVSSHDLALGMLNALYAEGFRITRTAPLDSPREIADDVSTPARNDR